MASRSTQGNTKRIGARPGTEPNGPEIEIAPRGPRAAAAKLFPVAAAAVAVSRLSARGPRHLSARDPRRLSARGQNHLSAWSECTAHRVCARSDGLLQRTQ